jgi:hypothetical protein
MFRPVSALLELPRRALRGRPRLRPRSRLTTKLLLVLAALGPGLIAANAGNDAGGIATYASVGGLAHIPKYVSVPVAALLVWLLLVRGSYKVAERIFVLMTIPFFAYPIAAILAKPQWVRSGTRLSCPTSSSTLAISSSSSQRQEQRSRRSCSFTSSRPWWKRESGQSN